METFVAMPEQLKERIEAWREQAGERLRIDTLRSYAGFTVYGLTLTDPIVGREHKRAHYFAQPHAHEPATTAGMVDVIHQLITGHALDGTPTSLDVDRVLRELVLSFNPIGNPEGRSRAPVLYWDGSTYSNDEFWCWMRGEDPDRPGEMWKRLDEWDDREERAPDPIGIVYEQVDAHTYVEPNRSHRSSYFGLFHRLDERYHYDCWLNLHQTEFVGSPYKCKILLPIEGLTEGKIAATNRSWGERVVAAWQAADLSPRPEPQRLGYTGQQAEYLRRTWRDLHKRMNIISTEVKNNAPDLPPADQQRAQSLAIIASIDRLMEEPA
jgi:hypothetical protein